MNDEPERRARQEALQHAMTVLGTAAHLRAVGTNERAVLLAARQQIAERGAPGAPGSPENVAGLDEKTAILKDVDAALGGENRASGYDPLTWAELRVQERLASILF